MMSLSETDLQHAQNRAEILIEAMPYIRQFNGELIVIKYGGSALINPAIKDTLLQDIALMRWVGMKPVIVHGGGPLINQTLSQQGIEPVFINGVRQTDPQTMAVVEMVLGGSINADIVGNLQRHGVQAVGLTGKDSQLVVARQRTDNPLDLVGEPESVNPALLLQLVQQEFIPVIAPVCSDAKGNTLNVNADSVATALAVALKARKLVFLSDVPGLLRNVNEPGSLISSLRVAELEALLADGTIGGGMIPKMRACAQAIQQGCVGQVHLIDGRRAHALLLEIYTQHGIGTEIIA